MKERPINLSAVEARASLAGKKTQFRRILTTQPEDHLFYQGRVSHSTIKEHEGRHLFIDAYPLLKQAQHIRCPFGAPRDRLWVRETTWWRFDGVDDRVFTGYVADGDPVRPGTHREAMMQQGPHFKVPSIHMPRKLSRITLEVVSVRVERLQDISEEDAIAEGINRIHHGRGEYCYDAFRDEPHPENSLCAEFAFEKLWKSINGLESWAENPWVWVVEFKVAKGGNP